MRRLMASASSSGGKVGETAVNAQRLESTPLVEHDFESEPVRILASEATCALLPPEIETEPLGEIALKGKQESLSLRRVRPRARD